LSLPLCYLDSSVILSYQIGPADHAYADAKNVFEVDIGGGATIGVVSLLTLMEIIDVIRKRVTERSNKLLLDAMVETRRNEFIKSETEARIKTLINNLTAMEKRGLLIFADFTPLDLKQVMDDVFTFSKGYFGMVKKYYHCGICRTPHESYSYKGLGWIDLMHAFLAIGLCVDSLVTADKSFSALSTDNRFSSINIEIIG
jgi:hypothetical protein